MDRQIFNFGGYSDLHGVCVNSDTFYTDTRGYGFLNQDNVSEDGTGLPSLLGGGFLHRVHDCAANFEESAYDTQWGVVQPMPRYPLRFKTLVPDNGVYRVTVKVHGPAQGIRSLLLYVMRRNLVVHHVAVAAGETRIFSCLVHVCPYLPAASHTVLEEKAIYVTLIGDPAVMSEIMIEKAEGPTIFVAGDSTLTDQSGRAPYYPAETCGGWAQALPALLNGNIALCNQAHSGLTAECFREDGHWDNIMHAIRAGDLLLMQFGHNDQKRRSQRANGKYADNLIEFIRQAREQGAYPIIATPLSRSVRDDEGNLNDVLSDYAAACIKVGRQTGTPVMDLHQKSFDLFDELGAQETLKYFCPNDFTHTNDFGSIKIALLVAQAARETNITQLTQYFADEPPQELLPLYGTWFPLSAPAPADFPAPYVDIAGSPDLKWIQKAVKAGLTDIFVMHLHPADALPRAQFIPLLFKAFSIPPRSFSTNSYHDVEKTDWECDLINTARAERLIDPATTPEDLFRPDDAITGEEAVEMIIRALLPAEKRDLSLSACLAQADRLNLLYEGFDAKAMIPRGKILRLLVTVMERNTQK